MIIFKTIKSLRRKMVCQFLAHIPLPLAIQCTVAQLLIANTCISLFEGFFWQPEMVMPVSKKNAPDGVIQTKKTLFKSIVIGVKTTAVRGERLSSTPDTIGTAGDLQPMGRIKGSVDRKLLRGTQVSRVGEDELDQISKVGISSLSHWTGLVGFLPKLGSADQEQARRNLTKVCQGKSPCHLSQEQARSSRELMVTGSNPEPWC